MKLYEPEMLTEILDSFNIEGNVKNICENHAGYVNKTFICETDLDKKYILQYVSNKAFPNLDILISNYEYISTYVNNTKNDGIDINVPRMVCQKNGKCVKRTDNGFWRTLVYFDNVYSMDIPSSQRVYSLAGRYFGKYIKKLSFLDPNVLQEVIPDFHNTYKRYSALEDMIKADPCGRVKNCEREIEIIRSKKDELSHISTLIQKGDLPTRITHNDTNLNNILFDNKTHMPVAIIDLDTTMPSCALYDYGDSLRVGSNTAKDDEKDLSKVKCNLNMYEAFTKGWLDGCGDILCECELANLIYAPTTITMEDGIRFLCDYISGDTYYHTSYKEQNLDRLRTQLALVDDMKQKESEIKQITERVLKYLNLPNVL